MGYVICEKCVGYYELEEGESVGEFEACQCGGSLNYTEFIKRQKKWIGLKINRSSSVQTV